MSRCLFTLAIKLSLQSHAFELEFNPNSQVMEEDKKKQVLGNGLATESESPVVAKVQTIVFLIINIILMLVFLIMLVVMALVTQQYLVINICFLPSLQALRMALV